MDHLLKPQRHSGNLQSVGNSGNVLPRTSHSMKIQDKLIREKPSLSYADFHHEITKNVQTPRKQRIDGKEIDEDELVKYMSNVPSYLQRGENLQEKALNVGVLDWGLLEKWRCNHKQMPHRNSRYSLSSSNTSSSFSTDESSTYSSRGHSCSPACQRTNRPSLPSHLVVSPTKGLSQAVNSFGASVEKLQAIDTTRSGPFNMSEKYISSVPALSQKHPDVRLEKCKENGSDLKRERNLGSGNAQYDQHYEMASHTTKNRGGECTNKDKIQKTSLKKFENSSPKGCKTIVLLLPRGLPESNHPGEPLNSNLTALAGQKSEQCEKECLAELNSNIPHSCPLPSGVGSKGSEVEYLCSLDSGAVSINRQSGSSHSVSLSPKVGLNPSRGRHLESKKSTVVPTCSTSVEHLKDSNKNSNKVAAEKVRSTSPYRSTGKMNKGSSLKDSLDIHNQGLTDVSAKSGTGNSLSSAADASSSDKRNATGRKSSPLRRLLDPLRKPKAENCHHFVDTLERGSVSRDRACKSADGRPLSFTLRPGKVKLDMTGCKSINVNELAKEKKHGPSTTQALLRVAVKNGLPLLTFAVGNESNILAATVKKLNTSKKDGCSYTYTFFTIQDIKKKNGSWINQGGKGKGHDYISNVVAQMKVSDSGYSNLSAQNKFCVRQFVLFSVDLRQADNQTSDFQPNDELAAIVVKFPKKTNPSSIKDGHGNTSRRNSKECLSGLSCQPFFGSQDFVSTTVILPSAIHSLPSKGGPSSLIERWTSGGSCDCGGWDMGCKLQILANQNQVHKKLSLSKSCPITDKLELFPQGGVQENQHVFSLAPFKEGIYSVEFNSSLSILQAFSICTAMLDSRKQCERLESSNSFEEKTFEEPMIVQNAGTSAPIRIEGEVPRYISYPPLSPVGRV